MLIGFSEIGQTDYPFLREMLYIAVFVPPGQQPLPRDIIDKPEIAKYIENWGRECDFGLKILIDNHPVGAVWGRLFTPDNHGWGFVDIDTPEMSIAVDRNYQNRGLGTRLMNEFFTLAENKGFRALSLSVDQLNPAVRLYQRLGFDIIKKAKSDFIMLRQLS